MLSLFSLCLSKRLQLDMVLSSLQDQSHVASLLGYSNLGEVTALGPPLTPAMSVRQPSSSSSIEAYDPLHLAEVLLRTLLLSIGFYTVWKKVPVCNFVSYVCRWGKNLLCYFWKNVVDCFPCQNTNLPIISECFGSHCYHWIRVMLLFFHMHSVFVCVHAGAGFWGIGEKQWQAPI